LNAGAVPPLLKIPCPLPFKMFQVAPARLFTTAPFCRNSSAPLETLPNVVVPDAFNVRVSKMRVPLGMLIPPLALVTPVPVIVPPVQVNSPVIAKVPVPVSVPPLSFKDAKVTVAPVASVTVPVVTLFVAVLRLELALKFTVAPEKFAVPVPLADDPALKLKVPPEKVSEAPVAALKLAASVPPPEKVSVPVFAATVPPVVLLKATLTLLLLPPVISNRPALLNAGAVPPLLKIPCPLPFKMFQVAPARLFTTAPFCRNSSAPETLPNVVVPDAFNVRVSRTREPLGMLMPPFVLVMPVPVHDPPVQFSTVVKFTLPVLVIVPALKFTLVVEIVSIPEPKFIVAPLKFTVPKPLIGPL
jgi:hypothetical protein